MKKTGYELAGYLALLVSIGSLFWNFNELVLLLITCVVNPYLFIKLHTFIVSRGTKYKQWFTVVIYFTILAIILGPISILIKYYVVTNMILLARGAGYIALGGLLLLERHKNNSLIQGFAILAIFSGITTIHTSLFTTFPKLLTVMTVETAKMYGVIKACAQIILYILLGINFLWGIKKEYDNPSNNNPSLE